MNLLMAAKTYVDKINLGRRGVADGKKINQFYGMVGEFAIYNYRKKPYPQDPRPMKHNGCFDLLECGKKIDVKSKPRRSMKIEGFQHMVFEAQKNHYSAQYYLFVSLQIPTSEDPPFFVFDDEAAILPERGIICGIIEKDEFFKKAERFHEESKINEDGESQYWKNAVYFLEQKHLIPLQIFLERG